MSVSGLAQCLDFCTFVFGEVFSFWSWFSCHFYVSDVLDTEYILDSNFTLIGARLYITLGGPTIYVDTHDNEVVGHWGTEQVTRWLPSEIADEINDLLIEVMGNRDGCPF